MNDAAAPRGPDGEGFLCWGPTQDAGCLPARQGASQPAPDGVALGLAHRRLSILDLSEAGHQPMMTPDGRYAITFNGEIYNYRELRVELAARGHTFHTASDTEVLLAAYAEWGIGCLHRLVGMWAFVIYDTHAQRLIAARDRYGVKPLYFAFDGARLGFASEIKQLYATGLHTGRAERAQVGQFLLYGDSNTHSQTMFEGVQQLLPGEWTNIALDSGPQRPVPKRWYELPAPGPMRASGDLAEYQAEFGRRLREAVAIHMRSDVPIGSCLSGGLDSSTLVLLMAEQRRAAGVSDQHTFTSCATDPRFDEWNFASQVVAAAGATGHRVFPQLDEVWDVLPDLTWQQDEPFGSLSIFAQWRVMALARSQGVKVLLDGQGADEVLKGYHRYVLQYLRTLAMERQHGQTALAALHLARTGMLHSTVALATGSPMAIAQKGLHFLRGRSTRRAGGLHGLMQPGHATPPLREGSTHFQHVRADVYGGLQSLLRFADRNSMACGVEARVPFLDHRLVEFFVEMPGAFKVRRGLTKPFLRDTMRGLMPEPVRLRMDKKGFVTPERVWYPTQLATIRQRLLASDSPIAEWVHPERLRHWLDDPRHATDFTVWRLLSTQAWMQRFGLR